jgi:hypothetical protein
MVRGVSSARAVKPGYVVRYPNRERRASQVTKVLVAAALVLSTVLMLAVTVGGWSKLAGLLPVNLIWCVVYLTIAYYVLRWARGLLPIAAALAALLFVFAVIATTSLDGVSWSDRSAPGYGAAHTLFGGSGLTPGTLNALTVAIAVAQALLIAIAMRGFSQRWNIEYEMPEGGSGS